MPPASLVDQQDVTPLGLAYQAIELQTTEDAARCRAAARAARDEGLIDGRPRHLPRRRRRDHLGGGADPRRPRATRVALVLPHGSRVATSRINFRLLARDAHDRTASGCRSCAGDAATRALAASAGLPIFATVGGVRVVGRGRRHRRRGCFGGRGRGRSRSRGRRERRRADARERDRGDAARRDRAVAATRTTTELVGRDRDRRHGRRRNRRAAGAGPPPRERTRPSVPRPAWRGRSRYGRNRSGGQPIARKPSERHAPQPASPPPGSSPTHRTSPRSDPRRDRNRLERASAERAAAFACGSAGRRSSSACGVLALALVVGGASGFLLLPTATAVVTPRTATLGPTSRCGSWPSTTATEPDLERAIVPAERDRDPPRGVRHASRRPASGSRRPEANGPGHVPELRPHVLQHRPAGQHRRDRGRHPVPDGQGGHDPGRRADLRPRPIVPARASVAVTAVRCRDRKATCAPNSIKDVPRGEEPFFTQGQQPGADDRRHARGVPARPAGGRRRGRRGDLTAAPRDGLRGAPRRPGPARRRRARSSPRPRRSATPTFYRRTAKLVGQEVETFELGSTTSRARSSRSTPRRSRQVAEATIAVEGRRRAIELDRRLQPRGRSGPCRDLGRRDHFPGRGHRPPGPPARPEAIKARDHRQAARPRPASILATYGEARPGGLAGLGGHGPDARHAGRGLDDQPTESTAKPRRSLAMTRPRHRPRGAADRHRRSPTARVPGPGR